MERKSIITSFKKYPAGVLVAAALLFAVLTETAVAASTDETAVRRALEQSFQQLRSGDYGALYDALPSSSQRRISRARFVSALERSRVLYELNRLEISAIRVSGDLAVADTVLYGRVRRPIDGEGKIVARQYLLREGGKWRIATDAGSTENSLLASNPGFVRRYPPSQPRIYFKRDGRWVDISSLGAARRPKR